MKNSVKNLLRGGVFVLAAVFAFAFTQPIDNSNPKFTENNGEWVLAGQLGVNYRCADVPTMICTVELVDNDPILGEVVENSEVFGEYTPL
ncbi:hypothetical protein ACFSKL_16370 [Belliella marina]|uniref:Uncharacterized protein n=1 Tax=Belliella marina TaxID=1644146 RepID=A0ABW4VQG1_9BACT